MPKNKNLQAALRRQQDEDFEMDALGGQCAHFNMRFEMAL
jgi:hypothetical protein